MERGLGGRVSRSLSAGACSGQRGLWRRGPALGLKILSLSDFGFRLLGFGFRVSGGFGVWVELDLLDISFGFRLEVLGFRFSVLDFRVQDFGVRIKGLGLGQDLRPGRGLPLSTVEG